MSDNKPLLTQRHPLMRHNLLSSAVRFLNSPGVKGTAIKSQVEFLKKKGLTQQEISSALASVSTTSVTRPDNKLHIAVAYSILPQGLTKVYAPIRILLTITRVAISLTVLLYICYRLVQAAMTLSPRLKLIIHNLYSKLRTVLGFKTREEAVEVDQPTEGLSLDSLQDLEDCQVINAELFDGKERGNSEFEIFQTELSDLKTKQESSITELKSEIRSIRSLLLSTSQFPKPQPAPDTSQVAIQKESIDFKPSGLFNRRCMEPTTVSQATSSDDSPDTGRNSQAMEFLHSLADPNPALKIATEGDTV